MGCRCQTANRRADHKNRFYETLVGVANATGMDEDREMIDIGGDQTPVTMNTTTAVPASARGRGDSALIARPRAVVEEILEEGLPRPSGMRRAF